MEVGVEAKVKYTLFKSVTGCKWCLLLGEIRNATQRRRSKFEKGNASVREFKVLTPESKLFRGHRRG